MSIGVFSTYGKILLVLFYSLGVFGDNVVNVKTALKSPCSPCTLNDFLRIFGICLNTFGVFYHYDQTLLA
jgi:hypothetical protein